MVELMSLTEQVDKEFSVARRRARLHALRRRRGGASGTGKLRSFDEERGTRGAYGGFRRGRSTVEVSRIVGSAGKHELFDDAFMPLRGASPDRWKRIDRAYRTGAELPPVTLLGLDGDYFVEDGHNRVSVARFHGAEWVDAEVTEFRTSGRTNGRAAGHPAPAETPGQA